MKKLLFLPLFLAVFSVAAADPVPLHVHFISGSKEYKSEASLRAFQNHLEATYHLDITASWVKDGAKDLPGVEHIKDTDVLLVFARRMKLPESQMKVIRAYWEAGKPIVGVRTSSHAFQQDDNEIFDRKVMGGNYQGHFGDEPVKVTTTGAGKNHPVMDGVEDIVSSKLYKAGDLSESATVLQNGTIESKDEVHPVTWTNTYNGGRTFYTSLGVPEDFEDEDFRQMLINAIFWTAEKKPEDFQR